MTSFGRKQSGFTKPFAWPAGNRDGFCREHWRFTLELGRYNLRESELRSASSLDCWLYWLLHAHEYEPAALLELLPQPAIRQAMETLARI
ncbi:MAG: hypothetical protein ACLP9L_16455 [Thermoguttaceae bacterium]